MLHKDLMPFSSEVLQKYFPTDNKNYVDYFENSIKRYKSYEDNKETTLQKNFYKLRQAEKDERFYTTRAFIKLFENRVNLKENLISILKMTFHETPPFDGVNSWDELIKDDITLCLEKDLSSPEGYRNYLRSNLEKRHFVKYILDLGKKDPNSSSMKNLEGASQIDALIECESTKFKILVEAKYLSDISHFVKYDVTRNQMARNIDVMLEDSDSKSLFILLTPKYFKENPKTRLYGYKFHDYKKPSTCSLKKDLCHRSEMTDSEWTSLSKRIGWLTFEDMEKL